MPVLEIRSFVDMEMLLMNEFDRTYHELMEIIHGQYGPDLIARLDNLAGEL